MFSFRGVTDGGELGIAAASAMAGVVRNTQMSAARDHVAGVNKPRRRVEVGGFFRNQRRYDMCDVPAGALVAERLRLRHSGMVRRTRPGISRFRALAARAPE